MNEERRGALTQNQEEIFEKLIKSRNKAVEAIDGTAITLIDNLAIEALLDAADKKNPEIRNFVYQVVDVIFVGLATLLEE